VRCRVICGTPDEPAKQVWLLLLRVKNFVRPFLSFSKTKYQHLEMAAAAVEEIRATSYVGFDSITSQIEHKLLKRGFQFNVIAVGG